MHNQNYVNVLRSEEIHKSLTKDQVHKRNNNSYFVATEHNPVAAEGSGGDSAGVRFGHTIRDFKALDKANATKYKFCCVYGQYVL